MGDPLYEPKARGINELPMRFDPERASVFELSVKSTMFEPKELPRDAR